MVKDLLQFEVSEYDGLPNVICKLCLRKLCEFADFKESCVDIKRTLEREYLSTQNFSVSTEKEDDKGCLKEYSIAPEQKIDIDDYDATGNSISNVGASIRIKQDPSPERCLSKDEYILPENVFQVVANEEYASDTKIELNFIKGEVDLNTDYVTQPKQVFPDIDQEDDDGIVNVEGRENKLLSSGEKCAEVGKSSFGNNKKNRRSKKVCNLRRKKSKFKNKHFICDVCGKETHRKDRMATHVRTHSGARPHKCKFCPKYFTQINILKRHELYHLGKRNYSCSKCSKTFITSSDLSKHSKTHRKELRYFCFHCDRGFMWKNDLVVHTRIHTGSKPYQCNQ